MIKYMVDSWRDKPRKVEVLKQTDKTVTIFDPEWGLERKYVNPDIFDSFEQAKAFLIEKQERKLQSMRLDLDRENGRLGNLKGMKDPDEATT